MDTYTSAGTAVAVTADTVVAIRANGASALTCTILNGNTSCTSSGTGTINASDLVGFAILSGSCPGGSGTYIRFAAKCQ